MGAVNGNSKSEINRLRERQADMSAKIAQISTDVDWLKSEMQELKDRQTRLENKMDKLYYMIIGTLLGTVINIIITLAMRGI